MKNTTAPISIDTNIIIRLCVNDVPHQVELANQCLKTHTAIYVSDTAVIEASFVLDNIYQFDRAQTAKTLLAILRQPNIICRLELFEQAFAHFLEHPPLSLEDCYLVLDAESQQATPLLTFDKKLAKQLQHAELLA